jgi:putative ABC transport system permease protein
MGTVLQDLKYGLRMLAKNPGFTAVAVLSLGLGIGANTTIFSFVNSLLFRPPAVEASGRLLELWQRNTKASGLEEYLPLSYPGYAYYRDHNQVFSSLLAFDGEMRPVSWGRSAQGGLVLGQLVSGDFFSTLGVKTVLGRAFLPDEDRIPAAHLVIVLSHAFWEQRLGSDPAILGKALTLNGADFTVVGVAPAGFTGIIMGNMPDFWAPLSATPEFTHEPHFLADWNTGWLFGVGRLKPGITASQARAGLNVLAHRLQQDHPESNKEKEAATFPVDLVPGPFRGYAAAFTGLLMAAVGMVLAIACANAANLQLAKAMGRRREIAIRSALGASRGRLVRQTLTESLLLSLMGGAAGLIFALWAVPPLLALKPASLPIRIDVPIDWRVLGFTLLLALTTSVAFGLAPALRSSKPELVPALKDETSIAGLRRSRLRSALVIAQVSVCLVLLISAGLCVRSLLNARSIDPGFDTQHALITQLDPGSLGYSESKGKAFYQQLLERVGALPGVSSASLAGFLPLGSANWTQGFVIDQREVGIDLTSAGPGFCQTMGISLLRGRDFTADDATASPKPVIINEAMARRFWPGQDPIGKRLGFSGDKSRSGLVVAGVVRTGKYHTLGEDPQPFLYLPFGYSPRATLVVRTEGDPRVLLTSVRRAVQALDPNVLPIDLETMKQYMALPLFPAHTTGLLLGSFGILALVLAVTGLYGVISYSVEQRSREIGVRMALGANQTDVLKLVLRHGMVLTLTGVTIGVIASFAVTRVLSSLLYGIRPTDPATYVSVSLMLAVVVLLASYIPARRATKVDPMVALRYE